MTPSSETLSVRDAYALIRSWCRENTQKYADGPLPSGMRDFREFARASQPFVDALPPVDTVSSLEAQAVLKEVLIGQLEWVYQVPGGRDTVAAGARAALMEEGISPFSKLTDEETACLRSEGSGLLRDFSKYVLP